MGAIVAILGEAGDPEVAERLQRMLARSPYRGEPELLVEGPLAIGIQSLGWDASLADAGNWLVAFHGYIGNWAELAAERGWRFPEGASNAGKIGVAFEDLGDRLFARLRGEWAVLIWNRRERTILAARDVVGCRPLFLHQHNERIFFATEIRQALSGSGATERLNPHAPADYLLFRFPENGRTFFDGVTMLPGGLAREIHADGSWPETDSEFWHPPPLRPSPSSSEELVEELRGLLEAAVRRSTPDTGVGVSLSGGMDSGSVWGTLASQVTPADLRFGKYRAYSNVYPGMPCDETPYIRSVHSFTGTEGVLVDSSDVLASEFLSILCSSLDRPHLPNSYPLDLILREASANGHRVVMTGFGGDEWLHGSLEYVRALFNSGHMIKAVRDLMSVRIPSWHQGVLSRIRWLAPGLGLSRLPGTRRGPSDLRHAIVAEAYREVDTPIRGSWNERMNDTSLSASRGALVRDLDRLAAAAALEINEQQAARLGIELRHPLTDLDIVEFAFCVEPREFIAGSCYKRLLRRAMTDRLPGDVIQRIEPTEFSCLFTRERGLLQRLPPGDSWNLAKLGVFDGKAIDRYLAAPYSKLSTVEILCAWWVDWFMGQTSAPGNCGFMVDGYRGGTHAAAIRQG